MVLTGCGSGPVLSFKDNSAYSNYNFLVSSSGAAGVASGFAKDLCVIETDQEDDPLEPMNSNAAAALFDLNRKETLYACNAYTQLYPASLTKIMTALVALENESPDTILTASSDVLVNDSQAQVIGLEEGDTMTLQQALNILLIYSANDVAILIAENIGGSMNHFIEMMNEEALALGATNTNFINSNGLSDENHYTTLYDMYLIFNKALEYQIFQEIINTPTYKTVYHSRSGEEKDVDIASTNYYLQHMAEAPTGVTVIGGKTGTTIAAGHCLVIMARDIGGNPYIGIVMRARDTDELYADMNAVLAKIPK